jgi:hypothetical protein
VEICEHQKNCSDKKKMAKRAAAMDHAGADTRVSCLATPALATNELPTQAPELTGHQHRYPSHASDHQIYGVSLCLSSANPFAFG